MYPPGADFISAIINNERKECFHESIHTSGEKNYSAERQ